MKMSLFLTEFEVRKFTSTQKYTKHVAKEKR